MLGNHVIRNATRARARRRRARRRDARASAASALLRRELPEQILPDGGHYERSPSTTSSCCATCSRFAPSAGARAGSTSRSSACGGSPPRSTRPDGAPALFNDGALDLAPAARASEPPTGRLAVFRGHRLRRPPRTAASGSRSTAARPRPPFLPAHAHADALSFQLWVGRPARRRRPGHVHLRGRAGS